ncbi:MAG: hypothetical protein K5739_04865 [Lachnospiraceae bacterium]|nr:hypothetical protein [Lachnospiraceae bacterium]
MENTNKTGAGQQHPDLIFWIVLLLSALLFCIKSLLVTDISLVDECYELSTAYRFYLGDAPFVHDWSPQQLQGIVILPAISLYCGLFHTTEGLVLFVRLFFLTLKTLLAAVMYLLLKKDDDSFFPVITLLLWFFFTPYNMDTMTYQAMPMVLLFPAALMLLKKPASRPGLILTGMFYAISILSQPFWIVSYPLFLLAGILRILSERKQAANGKSSDQKVIRGLLFWHIGIGIVFILFCLCLLKRTNPSSVISNIPYMFAEQDHDVAGNGIGHMIYQHVILVYGEMLITHLPVTLINGIYLMLLIFLKDKRKQLSGGMMICLVLSQISLFFTGKPHYMNMFWIPFVWTGIQLLFYCRKKDYLSLLLSAHVFAAMVALGTDTGSHATSAGFCLPGLVAMLFMGRAFATPSSGEKQGFAKAADVMIKRCLPLITVTLCLLLHVLITWGSVVSKADFAFPIKEGPMKHLYASEARYIAYTMELEDIKSLNLSKEDVLFCGLSNPLAYLDAGVIPGSLATLFPTADMEHQKLYYRMHPDHFPTKVYYDVRLPEDFLSDPDMKEMFGQGTMRYLTYGTVIETGRSK